MRAELLELLHRAGEWRGEIDPLLYPERCTSPMHLRAQGNIHNISHGGPARTARRRACRAFVQPGTRQVSSDFPGRASARGGLDITGGTTPDRDPRCE